VLCAPTVFAQQGPGKTPTPTRQPPTRDARGSSPRVELPTPVAETPATPDAPQGGASSLSLSFPNPDTDFDLKRVKGSPFSAEATTEHVQVFGDGNRAVRKTSARLFRDGAGRTRREHTLERGGRPAPGGVEQAPHFVIINDPVGQVRYEFDTRTRTVRKFTLTPRQAVGQRLMFGGGDNGAFGALMSAGSGRQRVTEGDADPPAAPRRERLEAREVEGLMAEGARTTLTIPTGVFDNEREIEITLEQWYSPELQTVVLVRHHDPRFGETTYRLSNVVRGEPDRTLFDPPGDYKIVDGMAPPYVPERETPPRVPPPGRP